MCLYGQPALKVRLEVPQAASGTGIGVEKAFLVEVNEPETGLTSA